MKKFWTILLILTICAALLGTACAKADPEQPGETQTEDDTLPPIDGPVYEGSDIASSPFVGTFQNTYSALFASLTADVFENADEIPLLVCYADGTFDMTVTDHAAHTIHSLSGTFTVDGETAAFTATDVGEVASVSGDSVHFTMKLLNEDEMKYDGEPLDCVSSGDIFTRSV